MTMMHSKKRMVALFLCGYLMGGGVWAHQVNLSTLVLSETGDGRHTVQLSAALTGFDAEINQNYPKGAYTTVEGFKRLVVERFGETVSLKLNQQTIGFENPTVTINHGTQLEADMAGVPDDIREIQLENTFFQDIYRNQLTVVFRKGGLPEQRYVLSRENHHRLHLVLANGIWQKVPSATVSDSSANLASEQKQTDNRAWQQSNAAYYIAAVALVALALVVGLFGRRAKRET